MTFATITRYGVPEFAETEANQRSGNLKGLKGTCKHFIFITTTKIGISESHHNHHRITSATIFTCILHIVTTNHK